jgi:hypothetical protein
MQVLDWIDGLAPGSGVIAPAGLTWENGLTTIRSSHC